MQARASDLADLADALHPLRPAAEPTLEQVKAAVDAGDDERAEELLLWAARDAQRLLEDTLLYSAQEGHIRFALSCAHIALQRGIELDMLPAILCLAKRCVERPQALCSLIRAGMGTDGIVRALLATRRENDTVILDALRKAHLIS